MASLENRLNGYNAVQDEPKMVMTDMMSLILAAAPTGEKEKRHYQG